jgi:polyhydroxybutyrate depolymerase
MDSWTGFSRVADSRGFVAVYPSAAGKFWNITASPSKADDVAYMRSLLDNVESQVCVDPDRVYATGVSNGGGMSGLLGCAMSDRLAAIAPVAGNYRPLPACKPERPVSMLEIHGTADIAVPYSIVPAWVNQWLRLDACPSGTHASRPAARVLHFDAGPCASGTRVGHVELFGEPHGWPGSANWTVWSFFSGLRRAPVPASS